ncbi:Chromosome segregation ATPase [Geosmithia morbida]|uniref:Chromosome segregation ATPase n=1 Tax=Geosmithia morbida TaxID=1094350 RepID=A0A9P5D5V8_9HYPO|nr:Chromosome segregation ATPase [Geosmithia morbida]KAF4124966.1 Chromosome segregation ATPase [Geosmithia morbida]
MEVDNASRYRSRILREMNANRKDPFNSPPSSTGSHGTVSPTTSSVFTDPEGESTRRLNEDIARLTNQKKLSVNWEIAHRKWPDFYSMPKDRAAANFDDHNNTNTRPMSAGSTKENRAPPTTSVRFDDDSSRDIWKGSQRTRSEMQPRVDDTDLSILSKSPGRGLTPQHVSSKSAYSPSPLAQARTQSYSATERKVSSSSYQAAVDSLRKTNSSSPKESPTPANKHVSSPHMSSARSSLTAVPPSPESIHNSPGQNAPSFIMPDVSHLEDFVTGTLRFAGSVQNGVPVFVKNGRVHDRRDKSSHQSHAEVDGLEVPEDEEKIFVSMDMIRQEILELRDHNDKVQEYAYGLQQQVETLERQVAEARNQTPTTRFTSSRVSEQLLEQNNELETEVASLQIRLEKASRKASNSDHLTEHNHRLEAEVVSLQSRLEQAARKLSLREIENDSLMQEKDRAVRKLQEACEDINKLTHKLSIKKKEYETTHRHQVESTEQMRQDYESLRREISMIQQGHDALEVENASLREENESLRQTVEELQQRAELKLLEMMTAHSQKKHRARSQSRASRASRTSRASRHHYTETIDVEETGESYTGEEERPAHVPSKEQQVPREDEQKPEKTQDVTNNHKINSQSNQDQERLRNDTVQSLWMPQPTETGFTDKTTESRPDFVEIDDLSLSSDEEEQEQCQALNEEPKRQQTRLESVVEETTHQSEKLHKTSHSRSQSQSRSQSKSRSHSRPRSSGKHAAFAEPTMEDTKTTAATAPAAAAATTKDSCPSLSPEARRILDGLCEHNCRNCTVCSRIAHRGVVTSSDVARGKKRVTIPRPIPVSDRNISTEDPTMRPAQAPGYALAVVIKGIEDEAQHLQLELSRLQAQYNASDKALGRRERLRMAAGVRAVLKQLEAKNDQVYNLYDVLEGQKVAEQEMTDEEIEMTVLHVTGMTVREVTSGGTEQLTWEGILDM